MFRKEVFTAKKQALLGNVFLVQPLSLSFYFYLLVSIALLCLFVIFKGSYARTEKVSGLLQPNPGLVKLYAPRSGLLKSLAVSEGEIVKQGQELALLSVATLNGQGQSVEDLAYASLIEQQGEINTQISLELNQLETEEALVAVEIESLKLEVESLVRRQNLQHNLVQSSASNLRRFDKLLETKFISRAAYEHVHKDWVRELNQDKKLEQELSHARAKLKLARMRMKSLPVEVNRRLGRLRAQKSELEARKAELSGRSIYRLSSPVNGKVVSVGLVNPGGSLRPDELIMTVMPDDSELEAVLFVPSRAIGFMKPGQEAMIFLEAYPYQFYGASRASIMEISASASWAYELERGYQSNEPLYKVKAKLERQYVKARGEVLGLQAGMLISANIVLERRNIFEWMLEPLRAVTKRS